MGSAASIPAPAGATAAGDWHHPEHPDDTPRRLFDVARHGTVHAYGVQAADGTIAAEPVAISVTHGDETLDLADVADAWAVYRNLGKALRAVSAFDALHNELAAAQG